MPDVLSIIRARRERRDRARHSANQRTQRFTFGIGFVISVLLALAIFGCALAYADLTRDLPAVDVLPTLFDSQTGTLLQPTRLYDRSGQHVILAIAPTDSPRHFIPLDPSAPEHLPVSLVQATLAVADPNFRLHHGYSLEGWNNPEEHPTLAQQLAADFLVWNEPPSIRRALRERLLAAQITLRFGREKVLEWYLNSANYGRFAFGADAAAHLYFGKPAADLDLAESALLAAVSQAPALNPIDAPEAALQRQQQTLEAMRLADLLTEDEAARAKREKLTFRSAPHGANDVPAFSNLVFSQLGRRFNLARLERGGLNIITTLDYDLQLQTACAVKTQSNRLAGSALEILAADDSPCLAARYLPTLPSGVSAPLASASAVVVDPRSGEVLSAVGEMGGGQESPFLADHRPGSLLTPFIYLTAFARGLGPASLLWDVPGNASELSSGVQNPDGRYHGPVRLRVAMANDYLVPAAQILAQMGFESVLRTAVPFGLPLVGSGDPYVLLIGDNPTSALEVAQAYGVFAAQGALNGQTLDDETLHTVAVRRVESVDHATWLDWTQPMTQQLVSPQLAYLMNDALSDDTARWPGLGHPNPLEIGRAAGAKIGQTQDGLDVWTAGYTPQRDVVVWMGASESLSPRAAAGLWSALMQYASRSLPPENWMPPPGVAVVDVCDPSGLLPTVDCPNVVNEVFLSGNEPTQTDDLYQTFEVNRETGYLATVFTPPQLIDKRVYLVVPPEAKVWAESAGLSTPPDAYDTIQAPPPNVDANIASPVMFADLRGRVQITGTASGKDFLFYRLLYGQGLNPQTWTQIGDDGSQPVEDSVLAEWDTSNLSGLYALKLEVVHNEQRLDTAAIQVTVDNQPPQVDLSFPQNGGEYSLSDYPRMTFQSQVSDNLFLQRVEFYLDDKLVASLTDMPFSLTWTAEVGNHRLRIVAIDRSGNQVEKVFSFTMEK
jgi:membrane peptidoglycan carboxypeptidase